MKKLTVTLTLILGMTMASFAQNGGLFQRGYVSDEVYYDAGSARPSGDSPLVLPGQHGSDTDTPAPIGSGIAVLVGLGAAYMVAKKRREE
jgi:hypothetical protein